MVIIKPLLPEDIKSKVLKRIEKLIKDSSGEIIGTDVWGKRHLAYKIKSHDEGYYVVLDVRLDPTQLKDIEKDMKLQSDILRCLLVRKDNL